MSRPPRTRRLLAKGRRLRRPGAGARIAPWRSAVTGGRWRSARRARDARRVQLPEAVDLAALVCSAGGTVALIVHHLARWAPPALAPTFSRATDALALGAGMSDALDAAAADLHPEGRSLVGALAAADRYGVPLGPLLERARHEAADDRARAVARAARRLPVLALFPLTTCVLPAFVLLTVVPLLAGALDGIGSGPTVP